MSKFLVVSWDKIEELTLRVCEKIIDSGFSPEVIVGILRGGWIVARLVSDYLGIGETGSIGVKFYEDVGKKAETPVITQPLVTDVRHRRVLIVDDVSDSGKTLQLVTELVKLYGPSSISTATLYVKPWTIMVPDYYAETTDLWIAFPWEPAEILRSLAREDRAEMTEENIIRLADKWGLSPRKNLELLARIIAKASLITNT